MRFAGWDTRRGQDGSPYLTRVWFGRLRLHAFHRGDLDRDCHDHPWSFWTFPLTGYWEDVLDIETGATRARFVRPFRLHRRAAAFAHRVLCNVDGGDRIVTLVWRGPVERKWGFWKFRAHERCWVHWRRYLLEGGKHAPCEDA